MDHVTVEQCREIVCERGMTWLAHHRCSICNSMTGYEFRHVSNVHTEWVAQLGLTGPDDTVVYFDARCGCTAYGESPRPVSWADFADAFNMQRTPEARASLWERFKAGKALFERD